MLFCQCTTRRTPRLTAEGWQASDGKSLPRSQWLPTGRPRAVVVAVHGLSGAASDFWPLGERLPPQGIAVHALELRGQGHDPDLSSRGGVRAARRWRQDLLEFDALVRQQHPGTPVFWLGESLGSLIVLHALPAAEGAAAPAGLILLSPAVGLRTPIPPWKYAALRVAGALAPHRRVSLADLNPSVGGLRVTSTTTQASQAPLTLHWVERQSLGLLAIIDRLMQFSRKSAGDLHLPVLVLHSPQDPVCDTPRVRAWLEKVPSHDKRLSLHEDSFHLILHDEHRWDAVEEIAGWIGQRALPPAGGT